jgi:DNA-binding transcriptional MerR regulator
VKPHDVAGYLEIAVPTVRQWASEYKEFLSPNAAGGDGRHRDFSDLDLRILNFIRQEKRKSVPAPEIHLALNRLQQENWEGLPYLSERPHVAQVPMVPEAAAHAALDAERRALLREIVLLRELLEKSEIEGKEKDAVIGEQTKEIKELTRQLAEVETELKLYRSGRLKPE